MQSNEDLQQQNNISSSFIQKQPPRLLSNISTVLFFQEHLFLDFFTSLHVGKSIIYTISGQTKMECTKLSTREKYVVNKGNPLFTTKFFINNKQ